MKKVLLTGGAGYIGSKLVGELLKESFEVTVIDTLKFKQDSLISYTNNPNFYFEKVDVRDYERYKPLVEKNDIIIPLACLTGAPLSNLHPTEAKDTNELAVSVLSEWTSKDQYVIYPCTNSGYGIGGDGMCNEESPLNPISEYGKTKVRAEKELLKAGNATTLRLATVFGISSRMRLDLLVNNLTYLALTTKSLVLFESSFRRNYIHIDDVCAVFRDACLNLDKYKREPYNLGLSKANLTKLELAQTIQKFVDCEIFDSDIGQDPDKRDYIVSNQKIESLGFSPSKTIEDGIKEIIKALPLLRQTREMLNY